MTNKHTATTSDGTGFIRNSKKTYSHMVAAQFTPEWFEAFKAHGEATHGAEWMALNLEHSRAKADEGRWIDLGWSSRLDLAEKNLASLKANPWYRGCRFELIETEVA